MNKKFRVLEHDVIYLSYDEPNSEENYTDLCKKIPWATRVHGINGSDAAHKECARISTTDRFITIDGDNIISSDFASKEFDIEDRLSFDRCVISWTAKNHINGLMYGNGGTKCWPKQYVLDMRSHENADPLNIAAQVDFCWDTEYIQMNSCYSEVFNNASPLQAWRAGFREGVKMSLDRGKKPTIDDFRKNHWKNLHRLYIWLMIGADVNNGLWALYGARQGLLKTMCSDWDFVNVRDFKWLNDFWHNNVCMLDDYELYTATVEFGNRIVAELEIPISPEPLSSSQSCFFKTVYQSPARSAKQQFIDRNT